MVQMSCSYHPITSIVSRPADYKNPLPLLDWVYTIQSLAYGQAREFHQPVAFSLTK